jgi:hypothetical protein
LSRPAFSRTFPGKFWSAAPRGRRREEIAMPTLRPVSRGSLLLLLLVGGWAGAARGGEPASRTNPFGIHGPQYSHWLTADAPHLWDEAEVRLDALGDTGAGWCRQDFWWSLVEPTPGEFVWEDFDRAVASYERHGLNLFVILCYHSAWSGGTSPTTDEERAAFGQYVYEMVKRYRGRVGAWEIWNEPNIQPFWSPRPSPELYAKLLQVAYRRAKEADPDCIVVGGAMAGPDAQFLAGMYEHGAKAHFDVLSYHNYGQENDITREWPAVAKLRAIMRAHDDEKPIWHTETGFYTGTRGLSEQEQASRTVRYSVGLLGLGIEKTFQLTLIDWSDDPGHANLTAQRGLLRAEYQAKPSLRAYQAMCDRLADKACVGLLRPAPGVHGLLFEGRDKDNVLVLWRDWDQLTASATFDLGTPVVLVQDLYGDYRVLRSPEGCYDIEVGRDPVYVLNVGAPLKRQAAVHWPGPVWTELPRVRSVPLEIDVTNPTDQPTRLSVAPYRKSGVWYTSDEIAPGATQAVRLDFNASALELGPHEFYWKLAAGDAGASPLVEGYRLVHVSPPVELGFAPLRKLDEDQPALAARVRYVGPVPADATVRLLTAGQATASPTPVTLQTQETIDVPLPLDLSHFADGDRVPLEATLNTQGVTLATRSARRLIRCPVAPAAAAADGDIGEWRGREPQIQPHQMTWEYVNAIQPPGKHDLAVKGWVAHDARGLWLALEVWDDAIVLPESRNVWDWDSVQVGLDLGSDAVAEAPYDNNDFEIELGLKRGGDGDAWCYLGHCPVGWPQEQLSEKLVAAVRSDEAAGVVTYELLIPADLLVSVIELAPDAVLGFSVLVNDNDGGGRAGWQELTPGIGLGKMPAQFAWLWLR